MKPFLWNKEADTLVKACKGLEGVRSLAACLHVSQRTILQRRAILRQREDKHWWKASELKQVVAAVVEGKKPKTIAAELGRTANSVSQQIHRLRKAGKLPPIHWTPEENARLLAGEHPSTFPGRSVHAARAQRKRLKETL